MKEYNWNEFTKRITIHADAQDIYDAWATQNGLEKWFLRKAQFHTPDNKKRERNEYIKTGDNYEWLWFGHPDSAVEKNKVLGGNGAGYLKFYFSGNCIVSVDIKKENGETVCELTQNMETAKEDERQLFYIECSTGWTFYLANLKSVLEGGIDLRNKNEEMRSVVNS